MPRCLTPMSSSTSNRRCSAGPAGTRSDIFMRFRGLRVADACCLSCWGNSSKSLTKRDRRSTCVFILGSVLCSRAHNSPHLLYGLYLHTPEHRIGLDAHQMQKVRVGQKLVDAISISTRSLDRVCECVCLSVCGQRRRSRALRVHDSRALLCELLLGYPHPAAEPSSQSNTPLGVFCVLALRQQNAHQVDMYNVSTKPIFNNGARAGSIYRCAYP